MGAEVLWQHTVVQFQRHPLAVRKKTTTRTPRPWRRSTPLRLRVSRQVSLTSVEDAVYLHTLEPRSAHICARHHVQEMFVPAVRHINEEATANVHLREEVVVLVPTNSANVSAEHQRPPRRLKAHSSLVSPVCSTRMQFFCAYGLQTLHECCRAGPCLAPQKRRS